MTPSFSLSRQIENENFEKYGVEEGWEESMVDNSLNDSIVSAVNYTSRVVLYRVHSAPTNIIHDKSPTESVA